ncbi:MAG TPA: hypothetical protein VL096_20430 [Pirellulaceae bacterium]|nr:hypothetical protein [Pirellulaceae bacterium]
MPASFDMLPVNELVAEQPRKSESLSDRLSELLVAVRRDSQSEPAVYLDETVVPFGGE